MKYTFSPNIAVYVKDLEKARRFYVDSLGFESIASTERWIELRSASTNLFLMRADTEFQVHELFVKDIDKAREDLISSGCEIIRWEGKGKDCYIKDPNGMFFNIWEVE